MKKVKKLLLWKKITQIFASRYEKIVKKWMNEVKSTIICLQEICENFQVFHYQKRKNN